MQCPHLSCNCHRRRASTLPKTCWQRLRCAGCPRSLSWQDHAKTIQITWIARHGETPATTTRRTQDNVQRTVAAKVTTSQPFNARRLAATVPSYGHRRHRKPKSWRIGYRLLVVYSAYSVPYWLFGSPWLFGSGARNIRVVRKAQPGLLKLKASKKACW